MTIETVETVEQIKKEIIQIIEPYIGVWLDFSGNDSERGEILEEIFGIKKNNDKKADYKGIIELKTAMIRPRLICFTPEEKKHWMKRENILLCTKSFSCTRSTNIQGKEYTTHISRDAKAIQILNSQNEIEMSLPFDRLESRLANKISNLAHFSYKTKKTPQGHKIQYTHVTFYTNYSFEIFLDLFEKGIITYELRNVYDKKKHKHVDKGPCFNITKKNLPLLYKEVYNYGGTYID